jgi:hypothetical protein
VKKMANKEKDTKKTVQAAPAKPVQKPAAPKK